MTPTSPVDGAPHRGLRFSIIVPTYRRRRSLERLVRSLLDVRFPRESFEVIIVNDGSPDDTAAYLEGLAEFPVFRSLSIPNSGPAVARNHGARIARGEILVFVDDDCTVPPDWLGRIDAVFAGNLLDAAGGEVRNALGRNPCAVAYDANHRFFVEVLNTPGGDAPYLTTNNFACRTAVFRELGGYDERFHVGGEDREFVARLIAAGRRVRYEPFVTVDHHHDFSLRGFIRQYYRFGKGAYLLHGIAAKERQMRTAGLGPGGYARLLLWVGHAHPLHERAGLIVLTVLAQASAAMGYLATAWEGLRDIPGEKRRIHSPQKLGIQGRVRELVSYLFGTAMSSALGLAAFFLLGRALSVQQYGVFIFAFSLTTVIQTLGSVGLSSAVTRHVVELIKTGDDGGRRAMLTAGLLLFGAVLAGLLGGLLVVWEPMRVRGAVAGDGDLLSLLVVGTIGSTAFEFFAAAYQIRFRLLRLALVRFAVSAVRMLAVGLALAMGVRDPLLLYLAFFAPAWIGAAVAAVEYIASGPLAGGVRGPMISRLATFAGWQTLSSATVILLQHAGSLILALAAGEEQAGLYGLGMTFSFVYGVVGAALGSYYVPIASRLRSQDDVREFLRRTNRINLPIMVVCTISLTAAVPLFTLVFGADKAGAVPSLLLLSLSAITGIGTVASLSLFHYFLQPRSITIAQAVSIAAFVIPASLLVDFGATGIASAYLASRVMLYITLQLLIRGEFARRGIAP